MVAFRMKISGPPLREIVRDAAKNCWGSKELGSVQIEIAHRFFHWLTLCFLQAFFKFPRENVVLHFFRFPRLPELIFALACLLGQDARGIRQVHIRSGLWRSSVRKHHGKFRVNFQARVAARADDIDGR